MHGNAAVVCFAVALGFVGPIAYFFLARRQGRPEGTLRELVRTLAYMVPFAVCGSVGLVYRSAHWLIYVAVGISVLGVLQQVRLTAAARRDSKNNRPNIL